MSLVTDRSLFWYPAAFPAAYVLISFSATPNPESALIRPLLLSVGATLFLHGILWLAIRDRRQAALITSGLVLIALAAWVPLTVTAVGLAWWFVIQRRRVMQGVPAMPIDSMQLSTIVRTLALLFVTVASIPVVVAIIAEAPWAQRASKSPATADGEDIVIILLDGYPRADAAWEMVSHDNSAFLRHLAGHGFDVAERAHSNYTATWVTLTSMFHGSYIDEIQDLPQPYPEDPAEQYRLLMRAIASAPTLEQLRQDGYDLVTIPPPLEGAQLDGADRYLRPSQMTAFELSLIQRSMAGSLALRMWPALPFDQHRDWTMASLRLLENELAADHERPRFVFAHLLSPHAPIVWDASGRALPPRECFPECSMYGPMSNKEWDLMPGQLQYLNELVLETVNAIASRNPETAIVLMSDHGTQRPGTTNANSFRSFFALRSAEAPEIPEDIQPVQIMELLLTGRTDERSYRGWVSAPEHPLSMAPYVGPEP